MRAALSRGALPTFALAGIVGTTLQHVPIVSAAVLPFLRFLIHILGCCIRYGEGAVKSRLWWSFVTFFLTYFPVKFGGLSWYVSQQLRVLPLGI